MRIALTAFVLIAAAGTAAAQSHAPRSTDELWKPTIGLPLPQIGLPLPQIGLPLPQLGLRPMERSERLERSERPERPERSTQRGAILFVPAFGWPYLPATAVPVPPAPLQEKHATGRLRLDMRPGVDPQIYVDGYYVGMLSDVSGELTLDIGTHTLELREDGYENLRVDVQISTDGLITYRGELKPVGRTDPTMRGADVRRSGADLQASGADLSGPRADIPPTTIYVIPGCYVGNVPPKDAGLPAACGQHPAVAFPSRP